MKHCYSLAILFLSVSSVSAVPPKVDFFFPAGAQRGTTVEITAGGVFERWPVQAWSESQGIHVKPAKASGKLSVTVAAEVEPGVYGIRLFDEQGASIARPFIVGTLPDMVEIEPNDDPKKPQVLDKPSVVVNGRLAKPGDVDTFAVMLAKGDTLIASVEAHRTLRSPMDGVVQVLSADGFVLEQNDDYHGFDPQIAFTALKNGTYLVRVFAFPAAADSTIGFAGKENYVYRLTLTTGPFVEYAFPLAVARSAPGSVEPIGWNIPDELRAFPVKPREGSNALQLYHPKIANPFFVRLEANPVVVKAKATREQPQAITLPITITGRLDRAGDIDVYRFDAKNGERLTFRIDARSLGFPLDPVLRLTDAVGKTLAQAQASVIGTDPPLDFTATHDGPYRLEVRDLHSHGGMRYVYRLRAGPIVPDFDLKIAADQFALTPAKSLEIPVTINRAGGFNQEITLSVQGLPKEITSTSTAKGLSLQLTTEKLAFTGSIRIVGTAKDGTIRYVHALVTDLTRTTEHLWLTVPRQ